MDETKILVSHDIGLHNSAITLKQRPKFKEGEGWLELLQQLPELVISGAIRDVAHEELLGVPPALSLVVAQLNLEIIHCRCFPHFIYSLTTQMKVDSRIFWFASNDVQEPIYLHFPAVEIMFSIEVANCLLRCRLGVHVNKPE